MRFFSLNVLLINILFSLYSINQTFTNENTIVASSINAPSLSIKKTGEYITASPIDTLPVFNMGESTVTNACSGILYDSGGPNGEYGVFENNFFTICPDEPFSCIAITIENYDTELEFDNIHLFEGTPNDLDFIASINGAGRLYLAYAASDCISINFSSDASVVGNGFKLTWECSPEECPVFEEKTCSTPHLIDAFPFQVDDLTTCFAGDNVESGICGGDEFLDGADYIFAYDSPGGECINIDLKGAIAGTGLSVFRGCPESINAVCVNQSQNIAGAINWQLPNVSLKEKDRYYFVVAHASNCTPFGLTITPATDCPKIFPSAAACENALVLNGCDMDLTSVLSVEQEAGSPDFFQFDVNNGCWVDVLQTNYTWFTFTAQGDGDFAFLLKNNNPNDVADIDFNIWGPFNQLDIACTNALSNQPIRSSWADDVEQGLTGLTHIDPFSGESITATCQGAAANGFLKPIAVKKGEIYIVLINDFDGHIFSGAIAADFSESDPIILGRLPAGVENSRDTLICQGTSIDLWATGASLYEWSPAESLSCRNCPNPIANPLESTTYTLKASTVCHTEERKIRVDVLQVDIGADQTVCLGTNVSINLTPFYEQFQYRWSSPTGEEFLSCLDCPNPIISSEQAGVFEYILALETPNCIIRDTMQLTVLKGEAPQYNIAANQQICLGDSLLLGINNPLDQTYHWSNNQGFTSVEANPLLQPSQSSTYYVSISSKDCPIPSLDSITVQVDSLPKHLLISPMDTLICLGESLNLEPPVFDITDFPNIQHQWISLPNFELLDSTYHLSLSPATSITLGRIDENGACTDTLFSNIVVIDSLVDITTDNANICEGESLQLIATVEEETTDFQWFPSDNLSCTDCLDPIVMPAQTTNYRIVGAIQDCSFEGNIEVNVTNVSEINLENRGEAIIYIGSEVDLVLHNNGLNFLSIEWLENGKVIAEANDTILNYAPLINEALTKEDRSVLIEANMITIDGCAFNTQVTILVKPPKIPNAFTPGTDGMNDYFNLFGNPTAASIGLFKIYNRWGKLVYDNDEPEKGWNGRLNNQGKMLPADVYLYQIQLKIGTEMKTFSGDVTLIR